MHTKKQKNYRRALRREEKCAVQVDGAMWVLSFAYYPRNRYAIEVRRKFWKNLADPHNPIIYVKRGMITPKNDGEYHHQQAQKALFVTAREMIVTDCRRSVFWRADGWEGCPWEEFSHEKQGADWKEQALHKLHAELCVEGVEIVKTDLHAESPVI
jgi:hypothetical protein